MIFTRKALSLLLVLSLISSYTPCFSAEACTKSKVDNSKSQSTWQKIKSTVTDTEKIKSFIANNKFVVPAAISAVILGALASPCIYSNIKYSKPRNPIEKNIKGETDDRVDTYTCLYSTNYSEYIANEHCKNNEEIANHRKEIGPKVDEILKEMDKNGCKTDYEKALFLHDYIYKHCKYDYGLAMKLFTHRKPNSNSSTRPNEPHGCLLDGNAICGGISEAYALLLQTAGIPCKVIYGPFMGSGHVWNIVKINGQWYHVDVTFDLWFTAFHGKYSWFMLTEKEITKDHTISFRTEKNTNQNPTPKNN